MRNLLNLRHFLIFTPLFLSGCINQIALNSIGGIMDNSFEVLNEEQDLKLAEASIASNLKLLEAVIKSDPENEKFLVMAAQGYASYALGFVEDDSHERAKVFYLRGRDYGMRALGNHGNLASALRGTVDELQVALRTLDEDEVPAVFWTAISWGSYIRWSLTDPSALVDLPKVEAMMKFVAEKDSSYYHGGAYFFLGTLYGSRPGFLGGDPELSRSYFERCLRINQGRFLMTYIFYASSLAYQTLDQALFEQCLSAVDSASLNVLPQARLSNVIAKRKAALLRNSMKDLF